MNVIVDAQVVAAFYKEDVLRAEHDLTQAVSDLFARFQSEDSLFLDDDGNIELEWRNLVDHDWFDAWLGDLMMNGRVFRVGVDSCTDLLKHLRINFGFPSASRDKWYVRTGKSVAISSDQAIILSEDLHFHEPRCGGSPARRRKVLTTQEGSMARYLRRTHAILVHSACKHAAHCACG